MLPAAAAHDMYRTLPCGSRDAYIVSGRIETRTKSVVSAEASRL
jgi:hypothetical protein